MFPFINQYINLYYYYTIQFIVHHIWKCKISHLVPALASSLYPSLTNHNPQDPSLHVLAPLPILSNPNHFLHALSSQPPPTPLIIMNLYLEKGCLWSSLTSRNQRVRGAMCRVKTVLARKQERKVTKVRQIWERAR